MTHLEDHGTPVGNLVSRLLQALQVSRLHSIFNVTLEEPVRELSAALEGHIAAHGYVSFKPDPKAELLFVNDQPVRTRRSAAGPIEGLIRFLGQMGVGELRFLRPLDERGVRAFLSAVNEHGKTNDPVSVCRRLEANGLAASVTLLTREQVAARAVRRDTIVDSRVLARLAYARTLTLLREYLRHMRDAELERYFWRRLIRAVQGLHGMLARSSRTLLALTLIKDADEPAINHAVNTCLLTLLLANKLGVSRAQAVNAGLAALLHGVGKFRTSPEVLAKEEDARTGAERKEYNDHPYRAVGAFLETRRLDDALLVAALVAFQYDADAARPVTSRPLDELHPLARLVAVCEAYDALTSPSPARPAVLPDRALTKMLAGEPRAFDEGLLGLFAGMLGLYPPGSAVRLDTGELAFVVHPNPDDPQRPLVAVVRDAAGRAVDGAMLDLAETTAQGGYRHRIVSTVDPSRAGIQVPEYMRGE